MLGEPANSDEPLVDEPAAAAAACICCQAGSAASRRNASRAGPESLRRRALACSKRAICAPSVLISSGR